MTPAGSTRTSSRAASSTRTSTAASSTTTSTSATASSPVLDVEQAEQMPAAGRAALRAGVVGNWIDNVHVFLPLTALAPALAVIAGPGVAASTGAVIVIAMMLGRPLGGMILGRVSDRLGRTRTTRIAITGTACCALLIAAVPTHEILGAGTIAVILVLRFLGGIFVAGEYSAAIPLAMEWSRPKRRGLMSGLILSMAPWAQGSIAFATAGLLVGLGPQRYAAWGWRLMFVVGALCSLGMLIYYRYRVVDAPVLHRQAASPAHTAHSGTAQASSTHPADSRTPQTGPAADRPVAGVREVLVGRWAPAFWQVFTLMSGLWLLTNAVVIMLTARLSTDAGLPATGVSVAMGVASVAQAILMAVAGHLSTLTGRRNLLVVWGAVAALAGPGLWWATVNSHTLGRAAILAAVLQVITVSAYGPVSAYLSERFPSEVRSTGYGMGYSLSLIVPALYPFYLPTLERAVGSHSAIMGLVALGGILVVIGALCGPRLGPSDIDAGIDEVAHASTRRRALRVPTSAGSR
ncbi:MAG: MFS transporter [Acidipropionibacterium jensenii]|nr:MFS transporter [Acidipropionibacterium jensenii]MDN5977511.1 MFS transporter [Acidipropionibacterium jensenii]